MIELEEGEKGRGVNLLLQLAGSGSRSGSGRNRRQFKSNRSYKYFVLSLFCLLFENEAKTIVKL